MKLPPKIEEMLNDVLASVRIWLTAQWADWRSCPGSCQRFVIRLAVISLILLFLILLGGCAALAVPPTPPCHAPDTTDLQPTREPPMQDETAKALIDEAAALREALRACNADKIRMHNYIKRRWK